MTYWLTACKPNCTVHSQVAGLQGNLYIRKKTGGGAESFPVGPPTSGTSVLSLSMIQTRQFSNPHSRAGIQHSLQPAACASLSSPADCAGNFGWLDVISGYAVVCVGTYRQWYTVHMRNHNCTQSPSVSLSCKLALSLLHLLLSYIVWFCINTIICIAFRTLMVF